MRNGMSVEEIREKVEGFDKLAEDYLMLMGAYNELVDKLGKTLFYFDHVADIYTSVKDSPEATEQDKLEFEGKIAGLKEAKGYVLNVLQECLGSEVEEESEDDLPRDTEETESAV